MKKCFFLFGLIIMSATFLTACQNTAAGFGEDMKRTGEAIKKSVS